MENKDLTNINDAAYQKLIDNITTLWGEAKSKAIAAVNTELLDANWQTGKYIVEFEQGGKQRAEYGKRLLVNLAKDLTARNGKGFNRTNLTYMRKLYLAFPKCGTLSHKLTWSHYTYLLSFDSSKILYYITICEQQNLSVRQLRERIKNNEYERLDDKTKQKLIEHKETKVEDFIKNPIVIGNSFNYEIISEKMLQKLILEDIPSFLDELGTGFTFIRNEYKIKMGNNYNYIDLLLFNYEFNCFVVVELKVTELKKEHIGQIEVYMNYIDKNLKKITQDKTIDIIICKKDNKFIMEYCSDERISVRKYELL